MQKSASRVIPLLCVGIVGCASLKELVTGKKADAKSGGKPQAPTGPKPITIKSFTDALAATAVAGSGNALYVGTARGLLRWDLTKGTSQLLTSTEGLPGNRVAAL